MASTLALKRRIHAARNVSKTTRAMQMISASKLKKAQQATISIRPYVEKLTQLAQSLEHADLQLPHPYLQQRMKTKKTLLIALSPDKGLSGSLVTNILREFFQFRKVETDAYYLTVGKKIEAQVVRLKNEVVASFTFGNTLPTLDMVYPITRIIDEYYLLEKVDSVKILSTNFASIFRQTPQITSILPISVPEDTKNIEQFQLIEPGINQILPPLLKKYLEMTVYRHLLESFVSEQASRMIAMQNATDNANDIIEDLLLEYNKTRQAKITSEILDLSAGATMTTYE